MCHLCTQVTFLIRDRLMCVWGGGGVAQGRAHLHTTAGPCVASHPLLLSIACWSGAEGLAWPQQTHRSWGGSCGSAGACAFASCEILHNSLVWERQEAALSGIVLCCADERRHSKRHTPVPSEHSFVQYDVLP